MATLTTTGIDFFFTSKPNHLGKLCRLLKQVAAMHKDLDVEPGFKFVQASTVSTSTRGKRFVITVRHAAIATAVVPMLHELRSIMANLGLPYDGAEFYVTDSPEVVMAYGNQFKS